MAATTDASWPPKKNTTWRVVFPMLDADGDPVSGITPDSERSIDQGTFADCSNEAIEIATASGMYYLDLNASEMNGDCIALKIKDTAANAKTTPIVVYPVAANFDGLEIIVSNIHSDLQIIEAAIDSDSVLYLADHDKTQSDVALLSTKIASDILALEGALDSDQVIISDAILDLQGAMDSDQTSIEGTVGTLSTKLGSDVLLIEAALDSDFLQLETACDSDQVSIEGKIDSDAVLAGADHDKTQSDIALVDAAIDSDSTLYIADHDKTQSDIADLSTKQDSDMVIVASDTNAIGTKIDSDVVVTDAKLDSDMTVLLTDHDKTQSDIALIDAAIDSDSTLYLTDHNKTQSDIALLDSPISDIESSLVITKSDLAVIEPVASDLAASAATIVHGTVSHDNSAASTTEFWSDDITEATADHFNGRIVIFTSGALQNQATDITDYELDTGEGHFTVTALTEAPADNVTFIIV